MNHKYAKDWQLQKRSNIFNLISFLSILVLPLTLTSQALAQEYEAISRLGTNQAICKPGIETGQELQDFFVNQRDDVIKILTDAGWAGNNDDLFTAVANGDFAEQSFEYGTKMEWMGLREEGEATASEKRIWTGDEAFEGFHVAVTSNCQIHEIIIPKACCNVSLVSSTAVPAPTSTVSVIQEGENDELVTISSTPGSVVMLTSPDGSSNAVATDANGSWSGELPAGAYSVSSQVMTDCGESPLAITDFTVREPVIAAAIPPPPATFKPFIAPFFGHENRNRPSHSGGIAGLIDCPAYLVGVKGGVIKDISERASVFVSAGVASNLNESSNSPLFVDVGAERKIGNNGFIGGGVGLWDINNSETKDESIFIHGGRDTSIKVKGNNAQWFIEGRIFADETDDIAHNRVITTGLRFILN